MFSIFLSFSSLARGRFRFLCYKPVFFGVAAAVDGEKMCESEHRENESLPQGLV